MTDGKKSKQRSVKVDPAKALKVAEEHIERATQRIEELAEAKEHLEQLVRKERADHEKTNFQRVNAENDIRRLKERVQNRDEVINGMAANLAAQTARANALELVLRMQSRYPVEQVLPQVAQQVGPLNASPIDGPMEQTAFYRR